MALKIALSIQNNMRIDAEKAQEIALHMTDWLDDLKLLNHTYDTIEDMDETEISNNILQFLIHAPEHIARAAQLMTDAPIDNIFDDAM
ncbi:hypothetical protein [Marinicella sp. W31]|uniref:hypothetical protein n=1 Tax=Marinicella sp. W31 TaxID=3023713 RepID=UPI003756B544